MLVGIGVTDGLIKSARICLLISNSVGWTSVGSTILVLWILCWFCIYAFVSTSLKFGSRMMPVSDRSLGRLGAGACWMPMANG